jgi:hypothetical protein
VRLRGRFFELTDRFTPDKRRQGASRASPEAVDGIRVADRSGSDRIPRLIISVPKRLLRSAVRRNAAKRVVRESWRLAAVHVRTRFAPPAVLVRLIGAPLAVSGERPLLGEFKRMLRVDADALWEASPTPGSKRRPRASS